MSVADEQVLILEKIASYSYTYDAGDTDGFAELFMQDAVWQYHLANQLEPEIHLASREEIRDWARDRLRGREGVLISRHHQSGTIFDILRSDYAETRTMVLVTHQEADQHHPVPTLSGVYHDVWEKTDQGWKFARRVLKTDRFRT